MIFFIQDNLIKAWQTSNSFSSATRIASSCAGDCKWGNTFGADHVGWLFFISTGDAVWRTFIANILLLNNRSIFSDIYLKIARLANQASNGTVTIITTGFTFTAYSWFRQEISCFTRQACCGSSLAINTWSLAFVAWSSTDTELIFKISFIYAAWTSVFVETFQASRIAGLTGRVGRV